MQVRTVRTRLPRVRNLMGDNGRQYTFVLLGCHGRLPGLRPAVLNLWVETPWGSRDPFTGISHQISYTSDVYITIQ